MADENSKRADDSCSFNGLTRGSLEPGGVPFFGGPKAAICGYCLPLVLDVLEMHQSGQALLTDNPAGLVCSFCGSAWRDDAPIVHGPGTGVCATCAIGFARSQPSYPWPESLEALGKR